MRFIVVFSFITFTFISFFPNVSLAAATFIVPAEGTLTQGFNPPAHRGIDIYKEPIRSTIKASASGIVTRASGGCGPRTDYCNGGLGNVVYIQHEINGQAYESVYAHLYDSINVTVGQRVTQGQKIGEMGNSGRVTGATGIHLHFELFKGNRNSGVAINPYDYFGKDLSPTPPKNTNPESIYHVIQVTNPQWGLYREAGNDSSKYIESLKNYDQWYMVVNKQQWVNGTLFYHIIRGTTDYGWTAASQVSTITPVWHTVQHESQGYDRAIVDDRYKVHTIPADAEVRIIRENSTMYLVNYNNFPQWILKNPPPKNTGVEPIYHAIHVTNPQWGLYREAGNDPAKYIEALNKYDQWYMVVNKQQWVNGTLYFHIKRGTTDYGWTAANQVNTISPVNITITKDTQGYHRSTVDNAYKAHLIPKGTSVRKLGETSNGMWIVLYQDFPQYIVPN